jgi:hypothetical protein
VVERHAVLLNNAEFCGEVIGALNAAAFNLPFCIVLTVLALLLLCFASWAAVLHLARARRPLRIVS